MADPAAYFFQQQRLRVQQNLQPLGITWMIYGIYRIFAGVLGAAIVHHLTHSGMFSDVPPFLPHLLASFVPFIAVFAGLMGAGDILTGFALLTRRPWARVLAMVFGILALLKLPFGTALGVYTFWVLGPRASGVEWEAISAQN